MFRRGRETYTPSPLDGAMGAIEEDYARQRKSDDEARKIFNKISPDVDRALQALADGKPDKFKLKSGTIRGLPSGKGYGAPWYHVSVSVFSGVDVDLNNYFGGWRVARCFVEYYGEQHGYDVKEGYGVKCRKHVNGSCMCRKKERDPKRTIVYVKLPEHLQ